MNSTTLLIDVMLDGRFICQLHYKKRGFPIMINGRISESYDNRDIERFIEEQRPSLKGKGYSYEFSKQMTYAY